MAVGLGDVDARADGGRHRFLDQIHAACARLDAGVHHGTLLYLGDAGGHTDNDPRLEHLEAAGDLVNELLQHPLRHVIVGDDALTQGTNGHDVAGGTAQHGLGLGAHLQQAAGILVDGHHRRLVQHDALTLDIYQNGSGTQIDTDIFCQRTHKLHLIISSFVLSCAAISRIFPN